MKNEATYNCDLCGRGYASRSTVSGDLGFYGSNWSWICGDVCDVCLRKAVAVLNKEFPKAKPIANVVGLPELISWKETKVSQS